MLKLVVFITLFFGKEIFACEEKWIGKWNAYDEWKSEYLISIKKNGNAISSYGNGEEGFWKIKDCNLEITWDSGKKDFIFNGVMGVQRLNDSKNKSYTSGMRKLSN